MSIEEKASVQIWWMLNRIKYLSCLSTKAGLVSLYMSEAIASIKEHEPSEDDKERIIRKLVSEGAIKIEPILREQGGVIATLSKLYGSTGPVCVGYKTEILEPRFSILLDRYRDAEELDQKVQVDSLRFNAVSGFLAYKGKVCQLRPNSIGLRFCASIFKYPKLQPVDWSEIAEGMADDEAEVLERKQIYDISRRLNEKIKKDLGLEKLFALDAKTVRRLL